MIVKAHAHLQFVIDVCWRGERTPTQCPFTGNLRYNVSALRLASPEEMSAASVGNVLCSSVLPDEVKGQCVGVSPLLLLKEYLEKTDHYPRV